MKSEKVKMTSEKTAINNRSKQSAEDVERLLDIHKHSVISALLLALEKIGALTRDQLFSDEFHAKIIAEYNKIVPLTFNHTWVTFHKKGEK